MASDSPEGLATGSHLCPGHSLTVINDHHERDPFVVVTAHPSPTPNRSREARSVSDGFQGLFRYNVPVLPHSSSRARSALRMPECLGSCGEVVLIFVLRHLQQPPASQQQQRFSCFLLAIPWTVVVRPHTGRIGRSKAARYACC